MSRRPAAALVASLLIAGAVHPAPPHSAGDGAGPAHAAPPLGFAPNVGQSDPGVSFLAHSGATTVFLSAAQTTLAMPGAVVRLSMAGADPAARLEGRDRLPGVENYLRGRDPRGWRTAVPTYATLGAHALYPGVDLARRGGPGELDDELVLAPGVDPGVVELGVDGARTMARDPAGGVRISAGGGSVVERAPRSFQLIGGVVHPVAAGYRILDGRRIALTVAAHDPGASLHVEPALGYAIDPLDPLGSRGFDQAAAVALDAAGDAYVGGATGSSDFPTTSGARQTTFGGATDAFVSKLNPTGTALVYSTFYGGSGFDQITGIAIDPAGDAHVTGYTDSPDLPTTAGAPQRSLRGQGNAFEAELNPAGSALLHATYLGGTVTDAAEGIALDRSGSAYITGFTRSPDFPTTPGAVQPGRGGADDAFVTRLSPDGAALVYSTYLGGSDIDHGAAIAVDATGVATVTGFTDSANFPTTAGAVQRSLAGGGGDAFVTRLNPTGSAVVASTFLGGTGDDEGTGVALGPGGDVFVTGFTGSPHFPTTRGAAQPTFHGGGHDAFVARLTPALTALVYSTYLGGSGFDLGQAIAVDPSGSAYVTGTTSSKGDFPITHGVVQSVYGGGGDDAFLARLSPDGTALLYSTYLGGSAPDQGAAIAVDPSGSAFVAGVTGSVNFPTTHDAVQSTGGGGGDEAFVTRVDPMATGLLYSTYLGGQSFDPTGLLSPGI